jgi:hypothetical protein
LAPQQGPAERHAADTEGEHGELIGQAIALCRPHRDQKNDAEREKNGLQRSGDQICHSSSRVRAAEYPKHQNPDRRNNDRVEQHQRRAEWAVGEGAADAVADKSGKKEGTDNAPNSSMRHGNSLLELLAHRALELPPYIVARRVEPLCLPLLRAAARDSRPRN